MNWREFWIALVAIVAWVCGIAVAKGFWITLLCVMCAPAAWVVLAMHFLA